MSQNCYSHSPQERVCLNGWVQGPGTGVRAPGRAEGRVWWCPAKKEASLRMESPVWESPASVLFILGAFSMPPLPAGVSSTGHLAHLASLFWNGSSLRGHLCSWCNKKPAAAWSSEFLSSEERLLFFQGTQVQFSACRWWPTTVHNPTSRGPDAFSGTRCALGTQAL